MQSEFRKDLKQANQNQEFIKQLLVDLFNINHLEESVGRVYWDLCAEHEGKKIYFECKEDFMAGKTGNIFLEYAQGKWGEEALPKGIFAGDNKVDTLIYTIHLKDKVEVWLFNVSELLSNIVAYKPRKADTSVKYKEDAHNSFGYLIPLDFLTKFGGTKVANI